MIARSILVLALFFVAGISALIYQFVWIRLLTHLLGGTSYAVSTVLAAFMGGLALGSRWLGARADRAGRPLRLYASLELGIGLIGGLIPFLVAVVEPLYVGAARTLPPQSHFLLRILVAFALLLPPTILMGGTLPVLGRWFVRAQESVGRGLGALYAVNTLGATAGSFLAGFVLIQVLGLHGSTGLAVAGNLLVALGALAIDRAGGPSRTVETAASEAPPRPMPLEGPRELTDRWLVTVFALSGATALAYEVLWTRALQHFLGNSTYAFSAMLTTFLLGLSGGGWLGGQLADRVRSPARWLGWTQIAIGATALASIPLIWMGLPAYEARGVTSASWSGFVFGRFLMAFAVMILPTMLFGMTFPLVNRIGIRNLERVGGRVGTLYFANTLGAIVGSLAAGFVALPLLGARNAIVAAAVVNLALGTRVHWLVRGPGGRVWLAPVAAVLILGVGFVAGREARAILSDTQSPGDRVLFDAEDSFAATRVYQKPNGEMHMSVDGHHIGGTNANVLRKEKILAHLPMALVDRAEAVLTVGLGSGITLGTLALYEEIATLMCVEIAPGVVEGAAYFRAEHGDVLADPRADLRVADGVQFLLTTERRFDVISSDSKLNPEYVGNASLLARDYYELCRDRLRDGGVMVQWLALNLPASELRTITRTFTRAFPYTVLLWHDPSNVILAGSSDPIAFRFDRMRRFASDPRVGPDLERIHVESPYAMASLRIAEDDDVRAAIGDGPINTWARPRTEFTMVRERRRQHGAAREDVNLRWLRDSRRPDLPPIRGDFDRDTMLRFVASAGKLLEGYAAGGGVAVLRTGTASFREGLAANPDDRRLELLLRRLRETETNRE